ncbi:Uncharacterized protein OBRU01_03515, partial [Operophtera brumata]
ASLEERLANTEFINNKNADASNVKEMEELRTRISAANRQTDKLMTELDCIKEKHEIIVKLKPNEDQAQKGKENINLPKVDYREKKTSR